MAFDHLGGYSLFVMDNKLHHTYSFMGVQTYQHESDKPLPTGRLRLRLDFEADAPVMAPAGTVSLFANDEPIGSGRMDHTVPILFTAYAGLDNGEVVDIRYETRPPMPSPAPSTRSPTTSDPRAKPTTRRSTRPNRRQPGPPHRVLLNLSKGTCQAWSKSEWGTQHLWPTAPCP